MAERVVLAMSGGVDSSVAAWLLKQQGYDVIGLFMRSGTESQESCRIDATAGSSAKNAAHLAPLPVITPAATHKGCCSAADAADARRVADMLDIPFHAIDFEQAFDRIRSYFVEEYLSGRTPNPCVMCNNWLKFGRLWEFARQVGADRIATGHYARIRPEPDAARAEAGSMRLLRGQDRTKDQSYVLFGIRRELLPHILFPVGEFAKAEIRQLARRAGLRVAEKPDSQEICFVPDGDYAGFIDRQAPHNRTDGEIVDVDGTVLGRHDGYHRFTIGQRRGLGIAQGSPRYVVAIEPASRRVVVGTKQDLACRELVADRLNWLIDEPPRVFPCVAQIRYRHAGAHARVERLDDDRIRVTFQDPQYGVTPGQAVVLYDGDRVLGGGWIC